MSLPLLREYRISRQTVFRLAPVRREAFGRKLLPAAAGGNLFDVRNASTKLGAYRT